MFLIGWPGGDLQSTLTIAAAIVLSYLALIWVTTILWAYRDIRGRSRDPLSQLVGVAIVVGLPLIGIPLYLVLRPTATLQQAYDRQLEQEAILSELHSISACPTCRRPVQGDFQVCPHCATSLKEACTQCGQLLTHAWRHCPYCATPKPATPKPATQTEPAREASRRDFDAGATAEDPPAPVSPSPASEEPATR